VSLLASKTTELEDAAPACPLILMQGKDERIAQAKQRLAKALDEPTVDADNADNADNDDNADNADNDDNDDNDEVLFDVLAGSDDEEAVAAPQHAFDIRSLKPKVPKSLLKTVGK
jgi:hypothetical protein